MLIGRHAALGALGLLAVMLAGGCGGGGDAGVPPAEAAPEAADAGQGRQGAEAVSPDSVAAEPVPAEGQRKTYAAPPPMRIDPKKKYVATVETTKGSFEIELFAADAPRTVNNFVFLAREGFYEGVRFHRIIRDFMVQTGDPKGDGTGGPGYTFEDELPPRRSYEPGIVAMANAGPDTNGSQFFICTGPACKNLDSTPNYTQFGRVVKGMDVVQSIAAVPVEPNEFGEESRPREEVRILRVSVEER